MKNVGSRVLMAALALFSAAWVAKAQDLPLLPYLDVSLLAEQRAADLVHRMTLEEKATQLVNQAPSVWSRLKPPSPKSGCHFWR